MIWVLIRAENFYEIICKVVSKEVILYHVKTCLGGNDLINMCIGRSKLTFKFLKFGLSPPPPKVLFIKDDEMRLPAL